MRPIDTAAIPSPAPLSPSTARAIPEIVQACSGMPLIKRLYLFGSRARGTDGPGSDFDFFCVLDTAAPNLARSYIDYIERLGAAVGGRQIDLVVDGYWNYRDLILKEEIERDRVLIYDRDAQ